MKFRDEIEKMERLSKEDPSYWNNIKFILGGLKKC